MANYFRQEVVYGLHQWITHQRVRIYFCRSHSVHIYLSIYLSQSVLIYLFKFCYLSFYQSIHLSPVLIYLSFSLSLSLYIYIYEGSLDKFPDFFRKGTLLIVHTWNSSPLQSNLLRLQCTCCTVPTTSGRPHGNPLVSAFQLPSSQTLSSPQFSHNNILWAWE